MTAITFEPSSVSNVTLSNGNLTGTNTSSAASTGCKSDAADAKSTGKWYFEVIFTNVGGGADQGAGIAGYSATYANLEVNATGGAILFLSGNLFVNGGSFANQLGAAISAGNRIAFAWDLTNSLIWVKNLTTGGNWNNSGTADPASGVGGDVLSGAASYVPFLTWGAGGTGQSMTAQFAAPMGGTIPSGFLAWDQTPPANTKRSQATVMS